MFAQDIPATPSQPAPIEPSADVIADSARPKKANFQVFEVQIFNQLGMVFNGEVVSLSSANNQGEFSLLPGHTNFISLITQPVMLYPREGSPQKFEVGLGILRCLYNKVEIFTGLLVNEESAALAQELQVSPENTKLPT